MSIFGSCFFSAKFSLMGLLRGPFSLFSVAVSRSVREVNT